MCEGRPELGGSAISNLRNGQGVIHFLRSLVITNWIKLRRLEQCCGRYGDPGCLTGPPDAQDERPSDE